MALSTLGTTVWEEIVARDAASDQAKWELQNLAHSLAEHAMPTFKAAHVAMTAMASLLKYHDTSMTRFDTYLAATVHRDDRHEEAS